MAKVYLLPNHHDIVPESYRDDNGDFDVEKFDECCKRMEKLMEDCEKDPFALYGKYMDQPDKDGCIGSIISFGVADGCACYMVMRKSPLTLCYLPNPDGYEADDCTLRGVNWSYIKKRAKMEKLFA